MKENLARYKVPRDVVFLDDLPRNPTGKILKRELVQIEVSSYPRRVDLCPPMGALMRRTGAGDEVLAEWSPSDEASVAAAEETYRHWLGQDYEAVQSDGTYFQPDRRRCLSRRRRAGDSQYGNGRRLTAQRRRRQRMRRPISAVS